MSEIASNDRNGNEDGNAITPDDIDNASNVNTEPVNGDDIAEDISKAEADINRRNAEADAIKAAAEDEPAIPPEVEAAAREAADKAKEVAGRAKGALGSLFGAVKSGWDDYTDDVRVPNDDKPATPAKTPAAPVPSTPDITSNDEIKLPSAGSVIKGAKGIGVSFLDGLLGRPKADGATVKVKGGWRLAVKGFTYFFAVIGVLAVFRAAIDAFRPRR